MENERRWKMSGAIVKLEKPGRAPVYMEWSVTGSGPGMGLMLAGFKAYYRERFGTEGMRRLEEERLPRVERDGYSGIHTLQELMRHHYEDAWGPRPILMDELWDRYVDGEICDECEDVRTRKEMEEIDGKFCTNAAGHEVCFFCMYKITPRPWPEVLNIPDDIDSTKVPLHDIRADPHHPMRPALKKWVNEMARNAVNTAVTSERILEVEDAVSRMRKELNDE